MSDARDTPADAPGRGVYLTCIALVAAAALAVVWVPALPPGTDTPTHLLFAARIAAGDAGGTWLVTHTPATSQAFVLLAAAFARALPLATAAKLALTTVVAGTAAAFWWLGCAFDRRPIGVPLGFAAALGFGFAMGFLNFQFAVALGVATLGAGVRAARNGGPARWALVGALLAATAWGHIIVAGMFGLELVIVTLACAPRAQRVRRLGALVGAAAPAAIFALVVVARVSAIEAADPAAAGVGTRSVPLVDVLLNVARTSYGPYAAAAWPAALATLGGAFLAARAHDPRRVLVPLTLLVWGVAYALIPFHLTGWAYAQPRVLALLLFVPAALAGAGPRPLWALGATTTAALATLVSALGTVVPLGEATALNAAMVSPAEPAGNVLSVRLDAGETPQIPYVQYLLHVDDYALIPGGASASQAHNNPWMHAVMHGPAATADFSTTPAEFIYRGLDCDLDPACEQNRAFLQDRVALAGLAYDTVVVVAQDVPFADALQARGYQNTALAAWRPRPRTVTLDVTFPENTDAWPIVARAGYPDTLGFFAGMRIPVGQRGRNERLPIGPVPAGPLRVQLGVEQPDGTIAPFFDVTVRVPVDEDPVITVAPGP